ncbi:hypothetical protein F2Q70_00022847 [Brassica cretica]|uniref:Uncharacterized protein n=1 Tax=Brassica cretica TaxID=69181 RepID=A0A8S9GRC2_BRACR|nr:hypothetical protein F2Q70_00022847 [Brassica cretica]
MAVISFKSHSLDRLMIMTNNEKVRWLSGSTQRFSHTTTRSRQFDTQGQWGGTELAKKSLRGFLARWPFGVSPVTIKNLTYTVLRTSGGLAAVLKVSHTPIRGRQFDTQEQRGGTGLGPRSSITVDRHQGFTIDRHSFISSTAPSHEANIPLFSKTSITSDLTVRLTSNRWHWKDLKEKSYPMYTKPHDKQVELIKVRSQLRFLQTFSASVDVIGSDIDQVLHDAREVVSTDNDQVLVNAGISTIFFGFVFDEQYLCFSVDRCYSDTATVILLQ